MPNGLKLELAEQTKVTKVKYAESPQATLSEITVEELNKKISQPFTYSNAIFSKTQSSSYYKEGHKTEYQDYTFKKFKELGFTDTSSFIICNMDKVGHGVFADRDFEPNECFILYAGVISNKSSEKLSSRYAFSFDTSVSLYVDAEKKGNISRFIQHMPINYNQFSEYRANFLKHDKDQIEKDKNLSDYWQWRNLEYKSNLTEADVAWANLTFMVIPIKGVPCLVLFNTKKINKGEQLGISYGHYYWLGRKLKPELFDLKGNIIPAHQYGYKEVVVQLPMMAALSQFRIFGQHCIEKSYTALTFKKGLEREKQSLHPIWFSHLAQPVSIFKLRELLLQYNVIGSEYNAIEHEFILQLRELLPTEFTVKMYERLPHKQSQKKIYDVVCHTNDLMKWSQLTVFIKNNTFGNISNLCIKVTQEVILPDIANNLMAQQLLILQLDTAKEQGFFKKPLSKDFIPMGPTYNDPTVLQKAITDEDINQILLHNPGITKADIQHHYDLIEKANSDPVSTLDMLNNLLIANSTANQSISEKEQKLNHITTAFFKTESSQNNFNWKVYPAERLTGKYIGHQVRFFNFPNESNNKPQQSKDFFNLLKKDGFEAELKELKDKRSSIVIDLTASVMNK